MKGLVIALCCLVALAAAEEKMAEMQTQVNTPVVPATQGALANGYGFGRNFMGMGMPGYYPGGPMVGNGFGMGMTGMGFPQFGGIYGGGMYPFGGVGQVGQSFPATMFGGMYPFGGMQTGYYPGGMTMGGMMPGMGGMMPGMGGMMPGMGGVMGGRVPGMGYQAMGQQTLVGAGGVKGGAL